MSNNPKKKPGFRLSSKLLCIVIPLTVLLATNLGAMFYSLFSAKSAFSTMQVVFALETELMRLQNTMGEFLLGEKHPNEVKELYGEVAEYLHVLRDGSKTLNVKESPGRLDEPDVRNLWWNWDRHIHYFEGVLGPLISEISETTTHEEREVIFSRYIGKSGVFLQDVNRTAIMARDYFLMRPFETFSHLAEGLLITSIAMSIASFFMMRLFIGRPLRAVTKGMEAVSSGKWGETVKVETRDVLGRLAQSFNTLSLELEKTMNALKTEKLELEEANKRLQESSIKDFLTGLYNHYFFQQILEVEYLRASRHATPLSLIMLDVDGFKHINDTFGHPFGDFVLQEMGRRTKESLRRTDIACRYGGEEFAILLPHTNYEGSQTVIQRLKEGLQERAFQNNIDSCNITVTIGISSLEEPEVKKETDLVRLADEALLEGKSRGGNCVILASQTRRQPGVDATTLEDYRRRLITTEKNLKRAYMDSTKALLRALEGKDDYSAVHSCLVATYAWYFTGVLNLPAEEREVIKNASLLYDLGKISIPDVILRKKGSLTSDEFSLVRQHPYYSASVVKGIKFLEQEVPIILHHHERWDGQGYPDGLKGKDVPLGARILALADTYEAVTSARPYRKGRPPEAAFKILREESGHQFDPELVEPFIKAMKEFLSTTSRVYISQLNRTVAIS